jgi:hypothetical protein
VHGEDGEVVGVAGLDGVGSWSLVFQRHGRQANSTSWLGQQAT